ncbi:phosphopantothenoylcysteine decarboxylase [Candidatus Omnitrophota bacterium]
MRILLTAGPTREPIDPARFISNYSTGTMGYELALEALKRGHHVVLVSGPTALILPKKAKIINIETAREMFSSVKTNFIKSDCIIMTAAVADFRPTKKRIKKIKRADNIGNILLKKNPDILSWLGKRKNKRLLVGFCMETEGLLKNAIKKKREKRLDLIVANKIDHKRSAFGKGRTSVVLIGPDSNIELKNVVKEKIARIILDKIEEMWYKKPHP